MLGPQAFQVSDPKIVNALTVDVEEYFQVSAFETHIEREQWGRMPSRVERSCDCILEIFDAHSVRATFFVLGWLAKRHPGLVRKLAAEGHEVASHGYAHVRATQQCPKEFLEDVSHTKKLLEDISGAPIKGYRAASFSILRNNLWALDKLAEAGYLYSSSIYPIRHDFYGIPDAPRFPFHPGERQILELPITTVRLWTRNWPAGGGGYFRLLPYRVSRWALRRVNRVDRRPCVFYFHPWEVDPDQPRVSGAKWKTRFRHYLNLQRTEARIVRLCQDFRWDRVDKLFLGTAGQSPSEG